ncbi:hypothetical protein L2E82_07880 [Cichorium intybus]|uniref:Uncharacterized protein n=1 Tax=Cichorium intybus TaxID=13427 RepID=A0ACB9G636_CICIN|nr:hypothetical protein L2E82_07880 [Cichorium intybus]
MGFRYLPNHEETYREYDFLPGHDSESLAPIFTPLIQFHIQNHIPFLHSKRFRFKAYSQTQSAKLPHINTALPSNKSHYANFQSPDPHLEALAVETLTLVSNFFLSARDPSTRVV